MNAQKRSRVYRSRRSGRTVLGLGIAYFGLTFAAVASCGAYIRRQVRCYAALQGRAHARRPRQVRRRLPQARGEPTARPRRRNAAQPRPLPRKEGRSATAWTEFTEALGIARKDDRPQRAEMAQQHIEALEPTLSRLIVQVPAGSDLPDLEIKRDGTAIRRAAWGRRCPSTPATTSSRRSRWGRSRGSKRSPWAGRRRPRPSPCRFSTMHPLLPHRPHRRRADTCRPLSSEVRKPVSPAVWVAYGIGAVGVGVGTYFGLRAMSGAADGGR